MQFARGCCDSASRTAVQQRAAACATCRQTTHAGLSTLTRDLPPRDRLPARPPRFAHKPAAVRPGGCQVVVLRLSRLALAWKLGFEPRSSLVCSDASPVEIHCEIPNVQTFLQSPPPSPTHSPHPTAIMVAPAKQRKIAIVGSRSVGLSSPLRSALSV